jgi:hypothetical protein
MLLSAAPRLVLNDTLVKRNRNGEYGIIAGRSSRTRARRRALARWRRGCQPARLVGLERSPGNQSPVSGETMPYRTALVAASSRECAPSLVSTF